MTKTPTGFTFRLPLRYRLARAFHLVLLLYLLWLGVARGLLAWQERVVLASAGVSPAPGYLVASGGLWVFLGLAGSVLLFVPRPWARWMLLGVDALLALSYWLDRLFLTRAADAQANWPFALLVTILFLVFSASLVYLLVQWEKQHGRG